MLSPLSKLISSKTGVNNTAAGYSNTTTYNNSIQTGPPLNTSTSGPPYPGSGSFSGPPGSNNPSHLSPFQELFASSPFSRVRQYYFVLELESLEFISITCSCFILVLKICFFFFSLFCTES